PPCCDLIVTTPKTSATQRLAPSLTSAAPHQPLARGVQIERRLVLRQEDVNSNVRLLGIDIGTTASRLAERVAHRILYPQRHEVEAPDRGLDGGGIDAYRAAHVEVPRPRQAARGVVDVLLAAV